MCRLTIWWKRAAGPRCGGSSPPWAMGLTAGSRWGSTLGSSRRPCRSCSRRQHASVERICRRYPRSVFARQSRRSCCCPILDVRIQQADLAVFFAGVAAVCLGCLHPADSTSHGFHRGTGYRLCRGDRRQCAPRLDTRRDRGRSTTRTSVRRAPSPNLGAAGSLRDPGRGAGAYSVAAARCGLLALTLMAPTGDAVLYSIAAKPTVAAWRRRFAVFSTISIASAGLARMHSWARSVFFSPTACFALTNLYSEMGADFQRPESWVTAVGPGRVSAIAMLHSVGCLVGILVPQPLSAHYRPVLAGLRAALWRR